MNVNVTLLFSQEAYAAGRRRVSRRIRDSAPRAMAPASKAIASVASFFISRIDSAVDALITERLDGATNARQRALLRSLQGKVAIANAKLTYQRYRELFDGPRWRALAHRGAPDTACACGPARGTKDAEPIAMCATWRSSSAPTP